MASFVKWICLAASVSVATGFDFGSLDPKAMIDKIRETLEMAVGMLWITGASMKCSKTLKRLVKDVFAGEMWALYVIDAMAKPEPGILEGGFNSIGSQSECLKAWARLNITGRDRNQSVWRVDHVQGHYCQVRYRIDLKNILEATKSSNASQTLLRMVDGMLGDDSYLLGEIEKVVEDFPGYFGLCMPSTCTRQDVQSIFTFIRPILKGFTNVDFSANVTSCKTKDQVETMRWDPPFLAAVIVLGIILTLVFFGTLVSLFDNLQMAPPRVPSKRTQNTTPGDFLRCFSVISSVRHLFSFASSRNTEELRCVHGLRALSVIWLIFGNILLLHSMMLTKNLLLLKDKMKDLTIQFMINFTPAADTIICLFGFMMTYVTIKTLRDQKAVQTRGFFLRYLMHRIARLAPLMVLATLLVVPLFPQSGQGPTWELEVNKFLSGCSRNWWWNVLHINNFLGRKEQCMEHTWLFALTMQCTIVAVIVIPVLYHRPAAGRLLVLMAILASMALTFALTLLFDLGPTWMLREYRPGTRNEYTEMVYIRPYTRSGVFWVGVLAGEVLSSRRKLCIHKAVSVLGWLCSLALVLYIIHAPFKWNRGLELPSTDVSAVYGAFSRILWATALSWMTVACASGHGGWLNNLLSFKCWLPLSRLLYSLYMVSPLVIVYSNGVREHSYYLSYDAMSYVLLHHFVLSLLAATAFSLSLELPLIKMAALVSRHWESKRDPKLDEPAIAVPRIGRHWLDKDFENPAFVKENKP
ncbi:nose resistant to fluoxetine protein 6 [Ixodes scapularis]|uniref:nose resistant to fluoxetine protein 6 n=1 Tax=Ixodes scapularis TaxID=6945 RepID=UPI001C39347A|nr:nose resistant to fluoxetine protein 6 [Ixodes scapularis]